MHSISSDDVTAARNQSAIETMSYELDVSRDHYRRRRARAIFEYGRPETDVETFQRARSYSVPNKMAAPNSVSKQEPTNQNGDAIRDHAYDRDVANHSGAERNNLPPSVPEEKGTHDVTNNDEVFTKAPVFGAGLRDKTKSNSFTNLWRRLTQYRMTSSKRELPATNVYTTTDDVERAQDRDFRAVRRHESLTSHDGVAGSRIRDKLNPMAASSRDVYAESRRHVSSDTAGTPRRRGLSRYSSDVTLMKSRRTSAIESQDGVPKLSPRPNNVMSPQRRNSLNHHDLLTSNVSRLPEPTSIKPSHELVRHESLSSADRIVTTKGRELVRHNSLQNSVNKTGVGDASELSRSQQAQRTVAKSRNDIVAPSRCDNLGRHGSLPTVAMSGNGIVTSPQCHDNGTSPQRRDNVISPQRYVSVTSPQRHENVTSPQRHDNVTSSQRHENVTSSQRHDLLPRNDIATASPNGDLSHDFQSTEVTPQRHKSQAARDSTESSRSRDTRPTMRTSSPDIVTSTARLHSSMRRPTTPPNNRSPRDPDKPADVTTVRRHHSMTQPSTSRDQIATRPTPTPTPRRTSSSMNRGRTSGRQLNASKDLQRTTRRPLSSPPPSLSSTSSDSRDNVRRKSPPKSKPRVSSLQRRNESRSTSYSSYVADNITSPQSHDNVTSPQHYNNIMSTTEHTHQAPPVRSESFQSSSPDCQDHTGRRPPMSKSKSSAQKGNQIGSDSAYPVPAPRQNPSEIPLEFYRIPPPEPFRSSSSESPDGPDQTARTPVALNKKSLNILPAAAARNQKKSDSDIPVQAGGQTVAITQRPPSSPESSTSTSSKGREQVGYASKSASKLGRSASTVGYSAIRIHRTASPQQTSGRSRSASTSRIGDHNFATRQEESTTKSSNFHYSLPTNQNGVPEAPAEVPDVLDKQSERRSRRETAISAPRVSEAITQLPSRQDGGHDYPDDASESRSRRETANIVVVRPLPASGPPTYRIDDDATKSRSGRRTDCLTPTAVMTGSDDEEDMRSRRRSISGVSIANRKKSSLRKTTRSHSSDRHVSYSNTDTVYRLMCCLC